MEDYPMKHKMLSPLLDFIFKGIFGEEDTKDILTAFLKEALTLPHEEYRLMTIEDPHINRKDKDDKLCVLDVVVRTTSGIRINVEVQIDSYAGLLKRFVVYPAKLLSWQIRKGDKYQKIPKVVSINILYKPLVHKEKSYYNTYRLRNIESGIELTDLLEIKILELSKLPAESDGTGLWSWAQFFKSKTEGEFMTVAEKDPAIGRAVRKLGELSQSEANQLRALARWKWWFDYHERLRENRIKGRKRGRAEGYKQAKAEDSELLRLKEEENRQQEEEISELRRRLAEKA
jgi:predicted transposase/invertase (TIGR01784 family)